MQEVQKKNENLSTKREVNWFMVIVQLQINFALVFSVGYLIYKGCMWKTFLLNIFLVQLSALGVYAGAHRLWAHGSYKATTGLKIFLMLCQSMAGCGSIYDWVSWHRLHHKYYETDLDPYNPSKGLYYAHVESSWKKLSPAQEKALKEIDMSDLEQDKVVMFQKKWYIPLLAVTTLLLPINAPAEYWGEDMWTSTIIMFWLRFGLGFHMACLVHSASRIWGLKKGEKFPADTNLVFLITKSYWLSYHYLAPWDYQVTEFSKYGTDCTSKFIRVCAALEYASDLKTIESRTVRGALIKSVVEKKPITECLLEMSEKQHLPEDHYLTPQKFYL